MFLNKLLNKGYQASQCQICQTQFNLMKLQRIHKCKRCQKFICNKCGKDKQKIIDKNGQWTDNAHRICIECKKDFVQIHQTIITNGMHWNRNTNMSDEWIHNMKKTLSTSDAKQQNFDLQYEHFLHFFSTNPKSFKQQTEIIFKDVIKGRTDSSVFNFSMRQFFYTVKSNIQDEASRQNVKKVLYAIAARYYKIGYCQGMSSIAAFILCFASEKNAFNIFCDLLENILPKDIFLQGKYGQSLSGLMQETYFVQEYFMHLILHIKRPLIQLNRQSFYNQNQLSHFRTVIQLLGSKVILSLFVGIVSFSVCIFIWQQLKENRSFQVIEKAFIAIFYMHRQKILENRSFKVIEQEIERMNLQEFKQFYYDVQIDQELKKQFLAKYQENLNKKWNPQSDHQVKSLNKLTKFSQKEILKLKQAFPESIQSKFSISKNDFIILVKQFYQNLTKQKSINLTELYTKENIQNIVDNFIIHNQKKLDLRQFFICLSFCIKNKLIKRLITLISVDQQEKDCQNFIKVQKFLNFLKKIIKATEIPQNGEKIKEQKKQFMKRLEKKYIITKDEQKFIRIKNLQTLLNDNYIYGLSDKLQFETEGILLKILQERKKQKIQ